MSEAGCGLTVLEGAIPPQTAGAKALRRFIETNQLYVVSALLMMLGCHLLMQSPLITGEQFARTVKSLLALQGYEVLVIAEAAVFAWLGVRFRMSAFLAVAVVQLIAFAVIVCIAFHKQTVLEWGSKPPAPEIPESDPVEASADSTGPEL